MGSSLPPGGDTLTVDGIDFTGPVLRTAEKACQEYLPPGGPPPQLSESARLDALRFAECMRAHGVPDFPDPTFTSSGRAPIKVVIAGAQSPAFKQAAAACGGRLP